MACAGCTVYRGVVLAGLKKGEWIGIVGSGGGLGHLGVQFAHALGLNVVGINARDEDLELTKKGGADVFVDARIGHNKVVDEAKNVTNGEGVAATINVSDASKAIATACAITAMHGTAIQIAQPNEVVIPFQKLISRDIRVKGSLICSAEEARAVLDVVAEHGISVETNPFKGLKEIGKLIDLAESGKMKGKGVIVMDEEQIRREEQSRLNMV
ncbi:NAD(P)-binding protein [Byssothecium circinans]|uniref:NAD(P)-binding protein n=1 Tax=Byssothecium circinans TaxID=147558 RepID=A0A6A5TQB6_9PLEO|nr:NAD(P)-binding protein [Byssothecium circinans]